MNHSVIGQLEHQLKLYQDSTSNQIAVLIIDSLNDEVLETYSIHVAEKWELGQASKDNGVLILLVIKHHQIRIEVGQGLEDVLTDALTNRIIRHEMVPQLRDGSYHGAITSAVDAIIKVIGNEYETSDDDVDDDGFSLGEKIMIGIFLFLILGGFTFIACFTDNPQGWGLYFFLIPFYGSFPLIIYGLSLGLKILISYVVLVPIAKLFIIHSAWGQAKLKKMKRYDTTGRGGSSRSSSFGSSSRSSSGGGFSGGGGSFGGGGSSGSW